jgi:hypothetical protein
MNLETRLLLGIGLVIVGAPFTFAGYGEGTILVITGSIMMVSVMVTQVI